jgi:hypothetical protein
MVGVYYNMMHHNHAIMQETTDNNRPADQSDQIHRSDHDEKQHLHRQRAKKRT